MNKKVFYIITIVLLTFSSCTTIENKIQTNFENLKYSKNSLNYEISPAHDFDKNGLMFSDQGAWFGYSFPNDTSMNPGFSGPFLMTEQNGIWSSPNLSILNIKDINWKHHKTLSFNSHLEQTFSNETLLLKQELVFLSGHTALIRATITNITDKATEINYNWETQNIFPESLTLLPHKNELTIPSSKTDAVGHILFPKTSSITVLDSAYKTSNQLYKLKPNTSKEIVISQTFIFPEYSWNDEQKLISDSNFDSILNARKTEKETQLTALIKQRKPQFQDTKYAEVLPKHI